MKIKRMNEKAIEPHYSTEGASAFDVFAYEDVKWKEELLTLKEDRTSAEYSMLEDLEDSFRVIKGFTALIPTGWAFEIPHEHGLFILSRSGHGFNHNTTLANSVGLLDYDYRGQAMVKLICFEIEPPEIKAGQAVAQCVLLNTPRCYFMISDELSETERGENGFGSTDKAKA